MGRDLRSGPNEEHQDVLRHAGKIADRSREVFTVGNASFIERYKWVDGHIAIRGIGACTAQHGFIVEAVPVPHGDGPDQARDKTYSSWRYERIQEAPVFSGQVELMEGTQQVIPSRVWLQRFDGVLTDLGKPLYLFEGPGVAVGQKLVLAFPNGK